VATRAVLPAMIAAARGSIVAFSSGYASTGYRNGANYAAAKAGVEALVKSVALENAQYGIRANSVAPGPIDTPMLTRERAAFIGPRIPLGRVGEPADIVGIVRFLIGDESAYITGQTIGVNGGLIMR
jgi:NAD(P)-dependent dehydrogenase (short-subunit alcohol dehydrogenase family)